MNDKSRLWLAGLLTAILIIMICFAAYTYRVPVAVQIRAVCFDQIFVWVSAKDDECTQPRNVKSALH